MSCTIFASTNLGAALFVIAHASIFFRTPFLHAGQYLIQNISLEEKREQLQKPLQECDKVLCTSPLRLQLPMSRFDVEKLQVVLFIE